MKERGLVFSALGLSRGAACFVVVIACLACGAGAPTATVENGSSELLTEVELTIVGEQRNSFPLPDVEALSSQEFPLPAETEATSLMFSARAGTRPVHAVCDSDQEGARIAWVWVQPDLTATCALTSGDASWF